MTYVLALLNKELWHPFRFVQAWLSVNSNIVTVFYWWHLFCCLYEERGKHLAASSCSHTGSSLQATTLSLVPYLVQFFPSFATILDVCLQTSRTFLLAAFNNNDYDWVSFRP